MELSNKAIIDTYFEDGRVLNGRAHSVQFGGKIGVMSKEVKELHSASEISFTTIVEDIKDLSIPKRIKFRIGDIVINVVDIVKLEFNISMYTRGDARGTMPYEDMEDFKKILQQNFT